MNERKPSIKVLCVAIDKYPIPRHELQGCNNDVVAFQEYLTAAIDKDSYDLDIRYLKDGEAKYEAIANTFLSHFEDLVDGDIGLFYYSGHGSQTPAPEVFWHNTPNHQHESLVCYDSRQPNGKDLLDKEIAWLIWKVTHEKAVNFSVILDACHSGTATRGKRVQARMTENAETLRPWTSYLGASDYLQEGEKVSVPNGHHFLLSACQPYETAKEKRIKGQTRGIFSYSLLEALKKSNGHLSFYELMIRTQAQVSNSSFQQHPQLETLGKASTDQLFLGAAILGKPTWSLVNFDKKLGWIVNAGTIHGIPLAGQSATTQWLVYPMESDNKDLKNHNEAIAKVTAKSVFATKTSLSGIKGWDIQAQFKAVLQDLGLPKLKVFIALEANQTAAAVLREEMAAAPSLFLEFVEEATDCDYYILAQQNKIYVFQPNDDAPVFKPLDGYSIKTVIQLIKNLETIAKWLNIKALENPYSKIALDEVSLEFYEVEEATANFLEVVSEKKVEDFLTEEVVLRYHFNPNKIDPEEQWEEPMFRLKVKNTSKQGRDLWVNVLFLGSDFGIDNDLLFNQKLEYGEDAWLYDYVESTSIIALHLEDEFKSWGINEINENLKIIVSTAPLNTNSFRQHGLPLADRLTDELRGNERGKGRKSKTNRISTTDWRTFDCTLKVVQPLNSYDIAENSVTSISDFEVKVTTPDNFKAQLRFGNSQEANRLNRSVSGLPKLDHPIVDFSSPKGNSPALDVIELHNITGKESIDESNPLAIEFNKELQENERLLAYGFNEELGLYLPVGLSDTDDSKKVIITSLPDEEAAGHRSLGRAIKLFFYKTALEPLGFEDEYPILAEVQIEENGDRVNYLKDEVALKERVASATNILIFIHGIIGNTKAMAMAAQKAYYLKDEQPISVGHHYDLILTFDYENLQTPIEETAKLFKQKLNAIGLVENDGKTVHLVAHSMGGLVSRWLIEKMNGDKIIDHLIQLGTPNAGSSWSNVQQMAKWVLTFAFGKLTIAEPIISTLAILGSYAEKTQVTFEQMRPKSDFMARLNDGTIAPIPYTILAGNTQSIEFRQKMKSANFFEKIRLFIKHVVAYKTLDKLLFREKNDIAVSVESIFDVPKTAQVTLEEVLSDHISYFGEAESLRVLGERIREINATL